MLIIKRWLHQQVSQRHCMYEAYWTLRGYGGSHFNDAHHQDNYRAYLWWKGLAEWFGVSLENVSYH